MEDLMFNIGFNTDLSGLTKLDNEISKVKQKLDIIDKQISNAKPFDDLTRLMERKENLLKSFSFLMRAYSELGNAINQANIKGQQLEKTQVVINQNAAKNASLFNVSTTQIEQNTKALHQNAVAADSAYSTDLIKLVKQLEKSVEQATTAINQQTRAYVAQNEAQQKNIDLKKQQVAAIAAARAVGTSGTAGAINDPLAATFIQENFDIGGDYFKRASAVAKQAALTAPIYGAAYAASTQITAGISDYIQMDTVLNRIAIVTNTTTENTRLMRGEFHKLAEELGVTSLVYTEAALAFYQQGGAAIEYVRELTEASIQLANITGRASADTSQYITAIGNSFKLIEKGPEAITRIVDVLAYLDKASAASADEIANALRRSASTFEAAGVEYERGAAMIATALQVTRLPEERIGTALKTITETLQEVRDKGPKAVGEFTNKIQQEIDKFPRLKKMGLQVFSPDGKEMESVTTFLSKLQEVYGTLKENEPMAAIAISQAIGGKENANVLQAILSNKDLFDELYAGAKKSSGEAQKSQEEYLKSIQANINKTKEAWEQFLAGLLDTGIIINILNGIAGALKTINSSLGETHQLLKLVAGALTTVYLLKKTGSFLSTTVLAGGEKKADASTGAAIAGSLVDQIAGGIDKTSTNSAKGKKIGERIFEFIKGNVSAAGKAGAGLGLVSVILGFVTDILTGEDWKMALGGAAAAGGGAALGAALGTLILPGIGTVIFGFLGSLLGANFWDFIKSKFLGEKTEADLVKVREESAKIKANLDKLEKIQEKVVEQGGIITGLSTEELEIYYKLNAELGKYNKLVDDAVKLTKENATQKDRLIEKEKQYLDLIKQKYSGMGFSAPTVESTTSGAAEAVFREKIKYNIGTQKALMLDAIQGSMASLGEENYQKMYKAIVDPAIDTFEETKNLFDQYSKEFADIDLFGSIKEQFDKLPIDINNENDKIAIELEAISSNVDKFSKEEIFNVIQNTYSKLGINSDFLTEFEGNREVLGDILNKIVVMFTKYTAMINELSKINKKIFAGYLPTAEDYATLEKAGKDYAATIGTTVDKVLNFTQETRTETYYEESGTRVPPKQSRFGATPFGGFDKSKISPLGPERKGLIKKPSGQIAYGALDPNKIYEKKTRQVPVGAPKLGANVVQTESGQIIEAMSARPAAEGIGIASDLLISRGRAIVADQEAKKKQAELDAELARLEEEKLAKEKRMAQTESYAPDKKALTRIETDFKDEEKRLDSLQDAIDYTIERSISVERKAAFIPTLYDKRAKIFNQIKISYRNSMDKLLAEDPEFKKYKDKLKVKDGLITEASSDALVASLTNNLRQAEERRNQFIDSIGNRKMVQWETDKLADIERIISKRSANLSNFADMLDHFRDLQSGYDSIVDKQKKDLEQRNQTEVALYKELAEKLKGPTLTEKTKEMLTEEEDRLISLIDSQIALLENKSMNLEDKFETLFNLSNKKIALIAKARDEAIAKTKTLTTGMREQGFGIQTDEFGFVTKESLADQRSLLEDAIREIEKKKFKIENPETPDKELSFVEKEKQLADLGVQLDSATKKLKDFGEAEQELSTYTAESIEKTELLTEAVHALRESIRESQLEMLESNLTESLFGETEIDKIERYFETLLEYQDRYANSLDKNISLAKLQNKIDQDKIKYGNTTQLAAFQEKITKMKKDGTEYSEEELKTLGSEYDLLLKRIALERTQKASGQVRLMRDAEGNWVYGAVAEGEKVAGTELAAKGDLIDAASKYYSEARSSVISTTQRMMKLSQSLITTLKDLAGEESKIEDKSFSEDQRKTAKANVESLRGVRDTLNQQILAERGSLERQKETFKKAAVAAGAAAAGDPVLIKFLDKILVTSEDKISEVFGKELPEELKSLLGISIGEIDKLTSIVGATLNSTIGILAANLSNLSSAISGTVTAIAASVSRISSIPIYTPSITAKPIPTDIETKPNKATEELISKETMENIIVKTVASRAGEVVVNKDGTINEKFGKGGATTREEISENINALIYKKGFLESEKERAKNVIAARKSIGLDVKLQEKYLESLKKFDTGGYTGDFSGGKVAMLHEKELVLNKVDTQNILDSVKISRQIASALDGNMIKNISGMIERNISSTNSTVINASFPNVSSSEEIRKAFANMSNNASQFAYRMRPQY